MRLTLLRAVRFVVAATACLMASLLVFGVSAAAAGPYYFHHDPVTVTNPSLTAVVIGFAVVLGIELALVVFFLLPRKHPAASARIETLRSEQKQEQTRRAASDSASTMPGGRGYGHTVAAPSVVTARSPTQCRRDVSPRSVTPAAWLLNLVALCLLDVQVRWR